MSSCGIAADETVSHALSIWSVGHSVCAAPKELARKQKLWDNSIVDQAFKSLLESATDSIDKARLLAVPAKRSSDWLHAFPISSCGLLLHNESVRVAIGFRLGAQLCDVHDCP